MNKQTNTIQDLSLSLSPSTLTDTIVQPGTMMIEGLQRERERIRSEKERERDEKGFSRRCRNHKLNNGNNVGADRIHMFDTISFDIDSREFQLEEKRNDSFSDQFRRTCFVKCCF